MKTLRTATNARKFVFQIENVATDAVNVGGTDYFGGVIYDKASAANPAFDFAVSSVSVYGAPVSGVSELKATGRVYYNKATGFFGVEILEAGEVPEPVVDVGDIIAISGSFIAPDSVNEKTLQRVIGGATPNLVNLGGPSSLEFDTSKEPIYFG